MDILTNQPTDEDLVDLITAEEDRAKQIEGQVAADAGEPPPPPAISDEDLVDISIESEKRAQEIETNLAVDQNKAIKPEEQARALRIADREGLPVDTVRRNLDKFDENPIDVGKMQAETPSLAKLSTTPHGPISQFDIETMGYVERVLRSYTQAYRGGFDDVEASDIGYKRRNGTATAEDLKRLEEIKASQKARQDFDIGSVAGFVEYPVASAPGMAITLARTWDETLAGVGAGAVIGGTAGAISGPGAIPAAVAGAGTGAVWGSRAGFVLESFYQLSGAAYNEALEARDENGNPLDENTAYAISTFAGGIGAVAELLPFEKALDTMPFLKGVVGKEGARQLSRFAANNPAARASLARIGRILKVGGAEAFTEVIQEATVLEGIIAAGGVTDENGNVLADQRLDRYGEAALGGFAGGSTLGAAGETVTATKDKIASMRLARAEARKQALVDLGDKLRSSKVNSLSPETVIAHAQQIDADGNGPQMSAPAEAIVKLFQSEGLTAEQVQQRFPALAAALDDAAQGNAEVPLNAETVIKLAQMEGFASITDDIRTGPDELTAREAKEREGELDDMIAGVSEEDQRAAVRASVEAEVTKQFVTAGMEQRVAETNARLHTTVLSRMAADSGKDLDTIMRENPLKIVREGMDETGLDGTTLQQADVLARSPELQDAMRKLQAGEITREDYAALVDKVKPVAPYAAVPQPASLEAMQAALTEDKVPKVGLPDQLPEGHPVGLRLDIPAYARHNTWVVSVHEQKPGFAAGQSIGYSSVARATNVELGVVQNAAVNIAGGKPKATIAVMKGSWKQTTPEQAKADADAALNDPAWRQIGMDPERHAYFYDRETMEPITNAEEVIQVGPLVLGKNVTYGDKSTFLFQSEAPAADTTLAGGLTDKAFVSIDTLKDATVIPIFADLTDAGRVYDKLDGVPIEPTYFFGGPNFPWLKKYLDARIVWAFNEPGKITALRNHVRNLRVQSEKEGKSGRVVVTVLAMKDDAHTSNSMVVGAAVRTVDAMVAAGRLKHDTLENAKELIRSKAVKKDTGYSELATFPGFEDKAALHDWIDKGSTFTGRKALAQEMNSATFRDIPGMFAIGRLFREALDPDYRATQVGDALLAFEIDPDATDLIVDFDDPAVKKAGIPRHPSYRYGMRGKLLGSFQTHIPMEILYKDLLPEVIGRSQPAEPKFLMERLSNGSAVEGKGDGKKTEFRISNDETSAGDLTVVVDGETLEDGAFSVVEKTVKAKDGEKQAWFLKLDEPPAKGTVVTTMWKADGQRVTQDVVDHAKVIEGLHDYRVAQAMTAALAGQWRSSDNDANKGGIQPAEFERAIGDNEAAVTLTPYTRDDVNKKKIRVFQLGSAPIKDGGLNTWFALKKGYDYSAEYPGDVTEKLIADGVLTKDEVAIVGVANNELGVKGMGTFQVLKAVEEGATVLDCFKVKSARKPFGLLPSIYATLGFEEVGAVPFAPEYYNDQQLADLKAVWSRQGWNETDGYPDVAIMKYRGSDAVRSEATRRFIAEGQAGLGIVDGRLAAFEAAEERLPQGAAVDDGRGGRAGEGDGRADPGSFRDRAGSLAGEGRAYVRNVLAADQRATDALKLPPDLINRIRERFPDLDPAKAPSPGPSSSEGTTTLYQPFDGQGTEPVSKAAQALADLKKTGFVSDQQVIGILGEFPGYLQEVAKFMAEQRQKLLDGKMSLRDVAKAYFITVSSMGSGAKSAEMVAGKTGMQVPQQFIENGKLRPEEAAAAWLGTPDGQAALDALEQGEFRADLWQKGTAVRTAYGDDRHATMGSMKPAGKNQFSMQNLQGLVEELNASKGDPAKIQAAVTKLKGIGTGKQGFIGHLLGMGNVPTIDAVEINTWIAGQGDIAQLKNKRADLARRIKESSSDQRVSAELLDRVTKRFEGLRKKVGADQVDPQVWQHIAHHWLWDRAKGIETTHGGLYEAMRFYQVVQSRTATKRGFIEIAPGRTEFKITLTGNADLSTFQHEAAHYYLEVLQKLVESGSASARMVADLEQLRAWMKLEPNQKIEVRHHEMFARGWEAYLMEGRSPSAELQGVFNRFRAWMVFVYKRMTALDVQLTDEVRSVFDRLVASDQEIAEARTNIGWGKPLPKEALYLSDDEYDRYVEAHAKAGEEQQRAVDARLMLEAANEAKDAWKEERRKLFEEEKAKLAETRGHRAWKLLTEGIGLETEAPGRTSLKIDPETVPAEWRRDTTGMTEEGGLPFDAVAEILGFDSGEQMISLIAGAKFASRDLPRQVQKMMEERHGALDATALADLAMQAVHSDQTQEVLLTEYRAMASQAGIGAPPKGLAKWLAAQAAQKVQALTKRQLDPMRWRRAELSAAQKAAAAKDPAKAAIHKRQQMMAAAMYKATIDAQKRVDVIRNKLMPFTKNDRRAKLGKAGDLYLDGIDQILEDIQLKPMSAAAVQKLDRLGKLVEEADKSGEPLVLPDKLRAMLGKKNFADMTLEELEGVHDAVMNIWHLAKLKNELKARAEKRDLEEALTEMEGNAQAALGDPKVTVQFTKGWKERAASRMRQFRAGLVKMEFLFGWLDGKPDGGLMHRMIYQPIADANKAKYDILKRFHKTLIERMRNMPNEQKARWETKRTFMGNPTANGATIISAALNLGNEGNKKKLLDGYGWNEQRLMAEINAFMTKADWDFVQHVWSEIDTLWPKIEATTKAATGLAPEKVVAAPIVTPFGTYAGGYYPVVYDPEQTFQQFKNQQESKGLFSNNYARPTLGDGFTKGRVDYAAPILLDLKVISQHLAEVVHYVTHYEAVTQADKITRHPRFQKLVTGHMGLEFYKTLRPWLQDVARDQDTPAITSQEPFAQAARYLRGGVSVSAMGYNVFTGLKQLIGIVQSLDAIGPVYWAQGLAESWLSPNAISNWKFAFKNSQELEPLITQFDRDIKMINDAYAKQGAMSIPATVSSWAFKHIGWLQSAVNVATWRGAYAQEMAISKDHEKAVMHADSVVRKTQSAGAVKDLSPIQRGSEINRAVSMFYSWFNVLYNRLEDIAKQTKGTRDVPKAAARVAILVMMSSMVEEASRRAWEAIVDNYEDDDEEAGYILSVLMKSADTLVGAIPMARVFASAGAAAGGLPPELFPAGRIVGDYYRTIGAVRDIVTKGEAPTRSEVKTAVRTVSALTQTPLSGPYNFLDELFGEAVFGEGKKTKP